MISPTGLTDDSQPHETSRHIPTFVWVALFVLLAVWAADRAGALDFWSTVGTSDGREVKIAAVYGAVDHPFHATRAESLRRALADGHFLRWIGSHQGGYPVEFYPLGVAGLEVALWALLAGSLPIALIHKLSIVLIFVAPGLAFALAGKRDRMPLGVGLVALAAHVVVRGWWWSGGYRELVEWGLVTNGAAATAALFVLVFLTSYLGDGRGYLAALAILCGSFSIYSNPRSAIALVLASVGAATATILAAGPSKAVLKRTGARLATVAAGILLIGSPEIISLVRFEDLYYFVRYERYDGLGAYLDSSIQAVSGPVFVAGITGLVMALIVPGRPVTRAAAVTLALYVATTAVLSAESLPGGAGEQLETTRLMPFQRLLVVFVAAVALYDVAGWLARVWPARRRLVTEVVLIVVTGALPLLYVLSPPSWIPEEDRGLVAVPTADTTGIADLEASVRAADVEAEPGTALLVLGSTLSWHTQLWAPQWSDRPYLYDDWLWYWQTRHLGPYDPLVEHAYEPARMDEVLTADYLTEHGIGAVIIAETARTAAAYRAVQSAPDLLLSRSGFYDVYLVRMPTTLVTFDGANANSIDVEDQVIRASGTSAGGLAKIKRNWFPRWRGWVNGEPAEITETGDGYMTVAVPPGQVEIEIRYVVDRWDWVGRALCSIGVLLVGCLLVLGTRVWREAVRQAPIPTVRSARR